MSVKQLVLALVLPAALAAQGASGLGDARPISLDEAIRLAQQNQPATVQARNALRTGESSIRQTLLGYLPSLSVGQSASQRGGTQLVQGVPPLAYDLCRSAEGGPSAAAGDIIVMHDGHHANPRADRAYAVAATAAARGLVGDFRRMDAEVLEFPDGGFDAVVCGLGLMYVAEPLNALREMRRVLRPGGRACAACWTSARRRPSSPAARSPARASRSSRASRCLRGC